MFISYKVWDRFLIEQDFALVTMLDKVNRDSARFNANGELAIGSQGK